MGRIKQLNGIAHNLAASFISITNDHFLFELGYIQKGEPAEITISLLDEKIQPDKFNTENLQKMIKHYKKWLFDQLEKIKIPKDKIKSVIILFTYKPGRNFGSYFTAKVDIKTITRTYSGEAKVGTF